MASSSTEPSNWKTRLVLELKRDKRKTIILGVMFLAAVFVFGRLFLKSAKPSKAGGAVRATAVVTPPKTASAAAGTGAAARPFGAIDKKPRTKVIPKINTTIDRDIFKLHLEFFPPDHEVVHKVLPTSGPAEPDLKAKQREIQTQARSLDVQSTIGGDSGAAIINGRVLRVGDEINGFRIVAITSNSCVVVKDDVKVQLVMPE